MTKTPKTPIDTRVLLAILDGWGIAPAGPGNAPHLAETPNLDAFRAAFPHTTLTAHNGAVGLPEGQMGNSEVGHLNIGAGRVVYQDFTRINRAVKDGSFAKNPTLNQFFDTAAKEGGRLHLLGLLSDGGVHSHIEHLKALLQLGAAKGLSDRVFIHCCMDGRDTPPESGKGYMEELVDIIRETGCGRVATIIGRYWIMDRDKRWDRVETAWKALMLGEGAPAEDPVAAVAEAYGRGETDEFIKPVVLRDKGGPAALMRDGDSLLLFNFRADRMRQLCHALTDADFTGFDASRRPKLRQLVTMTEYEADFPFPIAFPPQSLAHILGETVSRAGIRQLRIAETEKYAHVTYFFNGGREEPFENEERVLIPSPRDVPTYDLKPEMSANEITDTLLSRLEEAEKAGRGFGLVILNFANGDMVGHTGVLPAAIRACAAVDACLGRIRAFLKERGWALLITADHGNCETMIDHDGGPHTAHTTNPVPFIAGADSLGGKKLREGGALRDIAPTILDLLHLPQPTDMDGESLLRNGKNPDN